MRIRFDTLTFSKPVVESTLNLCNIFIFYFIYNCYDSYSQSIYLGYEEVEIRRRNRSIQYIW